jgi:NADH-quinone oxidoreductase subunit N
MNAFVPPNLMPALPELVLLGMACLVLVVDLFLPQQKRGFTLLLALAALVLTAVALWQVAPVEIVVSFNGSFVLDRLAVMLKLGLLLILFLVFVYSREFLREFGMYKGEYYALGLFATLGMMIMISAYNFLLLYLGLELLALSLYAMIAFKRDSSIAAEAAMKYFVLGAMASGLLLYGMSLFYGATGTLDLSRLSDILQVQASSSPILLSFALTFIIVGLAFKLGAVPFHMWLPDVYHGAPTSVTLFLGTAPKIAGFAMAIRLLVDGASPLQPEWSQMFVVLAVASLAIGNIVAIAQTNFKRMLAYSTISHVGFIMMGLLAGGSTGYAAAMFYTLTYALTAAVAFGVLMLLSRDGREASDLADLRGLNDRHPWYAALLAIALFSMAGVPPTVGFYAKLVVVNAVIQVDLLWLAVVAVLFSVAGLFYYLRAVKVMYFDKPEEDRLFRVQDALDSRLLLSANGLSLLLLGLFPSTLMAWCLTAFV